VTFRFVPLITQIAPPPGLGRASWSCTPHYPFCFLLYHLILPSIAVALTPLEDSSLANFWSPSSSKDSVFKYLVFRSASFFANVLYAPRNVGRGGPFKFLHRLRPPPIDDAYSSPPAVVPQLHHPLIVPFLRPLFFVDLSKCLCRPDPTARSYPSASNFFPVCPSCSERGV